MKAIHALRRPAAEKRQGTKSREVGTRQCSGAYGDFRMVLDWISKSGGLAECFHNFRVLA